MNPQAIFLPALAMVVLTFAVWWRMYFTRLGQMRRDRIHPQSVANSGQAAALLTDSRAADNFRNLFELPVLFYLALVVASLADLVTMAVLVLAWLFVLLRVVHSAIHCTYNKVMHRFLSYAIGGFVLWILWGLLGLGLLKG